MRRRGSRTSSRWTCETCTELNLSSPFESSARTAAPSPRPSATSTQRTRIRSTSTSLPPLTLHFFSLCCCCCCWHAARQRADRALTRRGTRSTHSTRFAPPRTVDPRTVDPCTSEICWCAQITSLSIVTLTKSCLRAVDCTYDEARGDSTLDAMPDVQCDGQDFIRQAAWAWFLIFVYLLAVPVVVWSVLYHAKQT